VGALEVFELLEATALATAGPNISNTSNTYIGGQVMTAAPPFNCADCGRTIGTSSTHAVDSGGKVLCSRCLTKTGNPDEFTWHASRAWCARALGVWP
jgi:hypothetical protein